MAEIFYLFMYSATYLLTYGARLAGGILIALAIWNDAKAQNNKYATMWALLTGFFGWIPAVIYLCVRKNQAGSIVPRPICMNCRAPLFPGQMHCQYCGAPVYQINPANIPNFCFPEEAAKRMKRAKIFLIVGIILVAASIVLPAVSTVAEMIMIFTESEFGGLYY